MGLMRKTRDKLPLECVLTDSEKLDYGKELSDTLNKKNGFENQLAQVQSQIKADIKSCEASVSSIVLKLNTGKETRDVECEIEYDFLRNEKRWIRQDTYEVVKIKPCTEDDLQESVI
jgi:ribonuclease HII